MGYHGNNSNKTSRTKFYIIRRLDNTEGTCFLNVVLQNLFAIDALRNYIVQSVHLDSFGPLTASLRKLFLDSTQYAGRSIRNRVIHPTPLFRAISTIFPDTYAPDKGGNTNRFVRHLLEGLSREERSSRLNPGGVSSYQAKKASGFVDTMFSINIATTLGLKYELCKRTYLRVSVPFEDKSVVSTERCLRENKQGKKVITYVGTVSIERLLEFNMTEKCAKITKAPPILIISLKMSSFQDMMHDRMFDGRVEFAHTLDLKPYIDPNCTDRNDSYTYQLTGLVHKIQPGHVISCIKGTNAKGHSAWYFVDNVTIKKLPAEEVLGHKPTLLFYQKC